MLVIFKLYKIFLILGEMKDSERNGKGTYYYENGDKYEG